MKNTTKKMASKKSAFVKAETKLITVVVASVDKRQVKEKGKRDKVTKFACECLPIDGGETFTVWVEANQPCPLAMSKQVCLSKFVPSKYKAPQVSFVNA
jgi:hypothetical protein